MKSRTLFQCWFLLITLLAFAFISEFMVKSFQSDGKIRLQRLAPITALPVIMREINHQKKNVQDKRKSSQKYARAVLTNGKTLEGIIVEEGDSWITLKVDGSLVGLSRSDLKELTLLAVPDAVKSK